jgi:hypothetical protein
LSRVLGRVGVRHPFKQATGLHCHFDFLKTNAPVLIEQLVFV